MSMNGTDKLKKMKNIIVLLVMIIIVIQGYSQNYNNNVNTNNNVNNVIVNNQPVIERVQYITKYRTIYVDKPQPKRYARKLSSPVCLLNKIWVYVEDLGEFKSLSDAWEIIEHLNTTGAYGRNDWRIPSSAELTVMEQNADKVGLGDDIYMATSHRNGILRPVSTGPSISQQQASYNQQLENNRRLEEEKKKRQQAQQIIINSGQGLSDGSRLIWATKNVGASSMQEKGSILSDYEPNGRWRLPSSKELQDFVNKASFSQRPYNGCIRKFFSYKGIVLIGGRYLTNDGYFDVGTNDGLSGRNGYVRLIQDIE